MHERPAYYVMLNKPAGVVSARDADHVCVVDIITLDGKPLAGGADGEPSRLAPWRHELSIVGRLDRSTTGLMLLTNDGHFMRRVTDGRFGKVQKEYHVTTLHPLSDLEDVISQFAQGLFLPDNDRTCRPAWIKRLGLSEEAASEEVAGHASSAARPAPPPPPPPSSSAAAAAASATNNHDFELESLVKGADRTYSITLTEGKRHQIKCMIHAVSKGTNRVVSLHRVRIGDLVMDEKALPPGAWRFLSDAEVRSFDPDGSRK